MATTQNISIMPTGIALHSDLNASTAVLETFIRRAVESMQDPESDPIGHYPLLWIYAALTGKDWDQIRDDATKRFARSLTDRQSDRFLAAIDSQNRDSRAIYRTICEYFSMFLYCKWAKAGSVRRHKWTSLELTLTCPCPENLEDLRRADFQEQLDASIAYLDFDIQ